MQDARKARVWQEDLIGIITEVVKGKERTLRAPEFQFEMTSEAANRNICIFRKHKNDLSRALQAQQDAFLEYRSEFRMTKTLEKCSSFTQTEKE
eukprot:9644319-Ditylum_brightwellii.AAC.1